MHLSGLFAEVAPDKQDAALFLRLVPCTPKQVGAPSELKCCKMGSAANVTGDR